MLASGMVTSLGLDLATSCASARAGVSRAGALPGFRLRSGIDGLEESAVGYAVPLLTRGFEADVRLVRLLQGALEDLAARCATSSETMCSLAAYLSLPDPERTQIVLPAADDAARTRLSARVGASAETFALASTVVAEAARMAGWVNRVELRFVSTAGHAGGLVALHRALDDLNKGRVREALVLAVDSLLDDDTLGWLHQSERFKCAAQPAGLQPGEAAVALLVLAVEAKACAPDGGAQLDLEHVALAAEERPFESHDGSTGRALAQALTEVSSGLASTKAWLVCDLNGEVYRAAELGLVMAQARRLNAALADPVVWLPAASFGDTGAASALCAVAMAQQAIARDYAPSSTGVVVAASDGQARAALRFSAVRQGSGRPDAPRRVAP
jgi:hypothetical protein